jgi:hypothetical protein
MFHYTDDKTVRIWWANGDLEEFAITGRIETENYFIVPATPGYELLNYLEDRNGDMVLERAPVVAWRIEEDQTKEHNSDLNLIAIALHSTSAESNSGVLCPDGKVMIRSYAAIFENVEEWKKSLSEKKEAA